MARKQKNSPTKQSSQSRLAATKPRRRWGVAVRLLILACVFGCALGLSWKIQVFGQSVNPASAAQTSPKRSALLAKLQQLQAQTATLRPSLNAGSLIALDNKMQQAKLAVAAGEYDTAGILLVDYASLLNSLRAQLLAQAAAPSPAETPIPNARVANAAAGSEQLPILIYHKPPADFGAQLDWLTAHGYHTITVSQLAAHLRTGAALPAKPVAITFDDGFYDQLSAFNQLQARGMKATFYVIIGGDASQHCIGIERTNTTCGDAYLNWDQVLALDRSGLIEIGAHTVDHLNLAAQSPAVQHFQIFASKQILEQHLGHSVVSFAYPYGSYNATTINEVRTAGFTSAVTTTEGTAQSLSTIYTLKRIRTATQLP